MSIVEEHRGCWLRPQTRRDRKDPTGDSRESTALSMLDFVRETYGRIHSCSKPPGWLGLDTAATGNPDSSSCYGSPILTLLDFPSAFIAADCHWATSDHSDHNYWPLLCPDLCPAHRFLCPVPDAHCSTRSAWAGVCAGKASVTLRPHSSSFPVPCSTHHLHPLPAGLLLPTNHTLRSRPLHLRPFLSCPTLAALL